MKLQDPTVIAQILDDPLPVLAEVVTGYVMTGNGFWTGFGCRLAQAAFKGRLFQQFGREFKQLREKGAIPENFAEKKYGFKSWVELLTILDEETPDEDRLEALKAMFYAVNKTNTTHGERILNYQLFQISKELTSGELLLLNAISQLNRQFPAGIPMNTRFASEVSKILGHDVTAVVRKDIRKLVSTNLIYAGSTTGDPYSPTDPTSGVVTDLGRRFIDNLYTYSVAIKESSA